MPTTASFHFEANELWVDSELLGASIPLERDGRRCELTFPEDNTSFGLDTSRDQPAVVGWSGTTDNPREQAAVIIIRVTVEIDADFRPEDISDRPTFEALHSLLAEAAVTAKGIVSDLYSWVRAAKGQHWLEPQYAAPVLTWMTDVRDADGNRLPTGYHDPLVVHAHSGPGLKRSDVEEVLSKAAHGEEPDLADQLLADAHFYLWRAHPPNPRIVVVLAAIAAEVRIKTFLTAHASSEQAQLVDLILSHPRDVSMAAVSLYDKGLLAVMGRSLREDDKAAYKALVGLFEVRNKVAHRGGSDSLDSRSVSEAVAAADGAFAYLASL